MDQVITS